MPQETDGRPSAAVPVKTRYDGSACLNVRSVLSVCNLMSSAGGSAAPLTWEQLSGVLWFVETCITSNHLFFDGTVPRETAAHAVDAVGELKKRCALEQFTVAPILPESPKALLETARQAMAEARLLLDHFAFRPEIDRPLDEKEYENFLGRLDLAISFPPSQREALALEWISDGFRGGKCLAAVIANGDEMLATARSLYDRYPGQGALLSGALINRFRLNYINLLAAGKRSAYVPDPGLESVTGDQVRLFKDYLIAQVGKQIKVDPGQPNIIVENMKSKNPLPSLGLYALMATKAVERPAAILETAYNEFRQDDALMRLIWENTRGGIALRKDSGEDAFVQAVEQHFYDKYKLLEKQASGIKLLTRKSKAVSYLVPAVLKGLAEALPKALGLGAVAEVVYRVLSKTATEASIPYLSDLLKSEDCESSISQYQSLKWDLREDPAVRVPLAALSEQVARVFGRPLGS